MVSSISNVIINVIILNVIVLYIYMYLYVSVDIYYIDVGIYTDNYAFYICIYIY